MTIALAFASGSTAYRELLWAGLGAAFGFAIATLICTARQRRSAAFSKAAEALRRSEERLRFALEATTEVVWDWNLEDDTMYAPRWAEAYGHPADVAPPTGRETLAYIHPDDAGPFQEQVQLASEGTRDTIEFEHRVRSGSGDWKWMLGRARVVERNGRGAAVRIVGTCADITERKRLLARLQIADRMASVGTLAAGVAHEINNPLAYVMSNVGYALEAMRAAAKALSEGRATLDSVAGVIAECGGALGEAQDGAERVRNIVRDLKVFSRAEDDERTSVRLDRVLQAALNLADTEIRYRARLVTDLASTPPVHANESRLAQVFLNLLVNAAQAIPEGRPGDNEIFVGTRVGPTGRAIVEIRDTGCGIPAENRQRIFDPFFTTKPVGVGTGLGLAICHGIVTALGGDIEVESEVGRGTSFRISLPAATPAQSVAPEPSPRRAPRRGRILVVDDEPLFCKSVERLLAPDHDIVSLSDPREALRRLEAGQRFDVILSDLAMPGMSGIELHAEISRMAPELAEGMLFVTGGAFTASAAEFLAQRPAQVLEKPLSPGAVRAAVADAMLRSPARPAAPVV